MNKNVYIFTKLLTLLSALSLLVVGGFLVYAALRAIYDKTGTINPEVTLLIWPGLFVLFVCLLITLSFVFIRKHHPVYLHYAAALVSAVVTLYLLFTLFGS